MSNLIIFMFKFLFLLPILLLNLKPILMCFYSKDKYLNCTQCFYGAKKNIFSLLKKKKKKPRLCALINLLITMQCSNIESRTFLCIVKNCGQS